MKSVTILSLLTVLFSMAALACPVETVEDSQLEVLKQIRGATENATVLRNAVELPQGGYLCTQYEVLCNCYSENPRPGAIAFLKKGNLSVFPNFLVHGKKHKDAIGVFGRMIGAKEDLNVKDFNGLSHNYFSINNGQRVIVETSGKLGDRNSDNPLEASLLDLSQTVINYLDCRSTSR